MINLIPKEEEKKIAMDFYRRLLVLFLLVFSISIFVACVAILPAYFIASVKESLINKKLEAQKDIPLPQIGEQSLAAVKDINSKLDLVEKAEKNKFLISENVMKALLLKKTPGIKIVQISFKNDQLQGKIITIQGTATSRETLLAFQEALEAIAGIDLRAQR